MVLASLCGFWSFFSSFVLSSDLCPFIHLPAKSRQKVPLPRGRRIICSLGLGGDCRPCAGWDGWLRAAGQVLGTHVGDSARGSLVASSPGPTQAAGRFIACQDVTCHRPLSHNRM